MKKDMRMQVLDELNTLENMLAVWIIMKGSEFCGRILARYSKSGCTTFVTLQLFEKSKWNSTAIYGHERLTGWGYNRTGTGIAQILTDNREKLEANFGIELSGKTWEVMNDWRKDMEKAGYTLIQAV